MRRQCPLALTLAALLLLAAAAAAASPLPTPDCGPHGTYNVTTGGCICEPGYTADGLECILDPCSEVSDPRATFCSGRGTCHPSREAPHYFRCECDCSCSGGCFGGPSCAAVLHTTEPFSEGWQAPPPAVTGTYDPVKVLSVRAAALSNVTVWVQQAAAPGGLLVVEYAAVDAPVGPGTDVWVGPLSFWRFFGGSGTIHLRMCTWCTEQPSVVAACRTRQLARLTLAHIPNPVCAAHFRCHSAGSFGCFEGLLQEPRAACSCREGWQGRWCSCRVEGPPVPVVVEPFEAASAGVVATADNTTTTTATTTVLVVTVDDISGQLPGAYATLRARLLLPHDGYRSLEVFFTADPAGVAELPAGALTLDTTPYVAPTAGGPLSVQVHATFRAHEVLALLRERGVPEAAAHLTVYPWVRVHDDCNRSRTTSAPGGVVRLQLARPLPAPLAEAPVFVSPQDALPGFPAALYRLDAVLTPTPAAAASVFLRGDTAGAEAVPRLVAAVHVASGVQEAQYAVSFTSDAAGERPLSGLPVRGIEVQPWLEGVHLLTVQLHAQDIRMTMAKEQQHQLPAFLWARLLEGGRPVPNGRTASGLPVVFRDDACAPQSNPCVNGGSCLQVRPMQGAPAALAGPVVCLCPCGFKGKYCETADPAFLAQCSPA